MENEAGGCRDFTLVDMSQPTESAFIDSASCHFSNNISVFIYEKSGKIFLDQKSINGGHTEEVQSCSSLHSRIQEIKSNPSEGLAARSTRDFVSRESVLLVTDEKTCLALDQEINELIKLWKDEGRKDSRRLCIPSTAIQNNNPSQIRAIIQLEAKKTQGILIVGSDIPPFEFYYATNWEAPWGAYKYGTTDLPYGNFDDPYWEKGLSKYSSGLREVIYKSVDYIYTLDRPTKIAYNLDHWVESQEENSKRPYSQDRWVSRWLSDPHRMKQDFARFVSRRKAYKPTRGQNILYARGAQGFMFRPGEHDTYDYLKQAMGHWKDALGDDSRVDFFAEADLQQVMRFLNPQLTFLNLMDHGEPEGFGNIRAPNLNEIGWVPPMVNYDSCLTGAWAYARSVSDSLVAHTFGMRAPPVALVASQGIKSLRTVGQADSTAFDVFLSPLTTEGLSGQSLGNRQKESLNLNLAGWRNKWLWPQISGSSKSDDVGQYLHSLSIFGDPTWEF